MIKLKEVFQSNIQFQNSHRADVLFFNCCDFRFRQQAQEFLGSKRADPITFPGGVMLFVGEKYGLADMKAGALYWTQAMVKLHHIREIVLVVHQGCGAYASALKFLRKTEREIYGLQLADALEVKNNLEIEIPGVKVSAFYMSLAADGQKVKISEIIP